MFMGFIKRFMVNSGVLCAKIMNQLQRLMAKKQTSSSESAVPISSVPARSRARAAKHSKAEITTAGTATVPEAVIAETAAEVLYDRNAIARLAYSFWEARGGAGGSESEDWLRAEKELRKQRKFAGSL